ncbi:MAG: peptidase [Bacteroidetes bacterium]|nr:peptidase [Bacteroidota bacterium]
MKKIYFMAGAALLSVNAFAQTSEAGKATVTGSKPFVHATSPDRITSPDTTGIVNVTEFLPEFLPGGGAASIYGYTGGGYIYGNNVSGNNLRIVAQGYDNLNVIPVHVEGVILWFGAQESDAGSSATSKVVISAYNMAPNKAKNTNGSGTFNSSTNNWEGPSGTAQSTANLLFSDIDTLGWNYVAFPTPATFVDDFALVMDVTALAAGDTVGLVSDNQNDAGNIDLTYHKIGTSWYVTDQLFSNAASPDFGSGGLDNNIAMWAVIEDATGVNEFFNGMKLTTYPNPVVSKTTIEYTLEKSSSNVTLTVYDQHGKKVVNNSYEKQDAGTYKVEVDASNLAAGTYIYQLRANGRNFTKKLVVTK